MPRAWQTVGVMSVPQGKEAAMCSMQDELLEIMFFTGLNVIVHWVCSLKLFSRYMTATIRRASEAVTNAIRRTQEVEASRSCAVYVLPMSRPDKNRCAVLVTNVKQFKPQSQEITML